MDREAPCSLPCELERHVLMRTGWRISNLLIELHAEHAVMRGRATTPFVRQLAEQAAKDLLPHVCLDNAIDVENEVEVLAGMPLH
jgi:hypothetical protein